MFATIILLGSLTVYPNVELTLIEHAQEQLESDFVVLKATMRLSRSNWLVRSAVQRAIVLNVRQRERNDSRYQSILDLQLDMAKLELHDALIGYLKSLKDPTDKELSMLQNSVSARDEALRRIRVRATDSRK